MKDYIRKNLNFVKKGTDSQKQYIEDKKKFEMLLANTNQNQNQNGKK